MLGRAFRRSIAGARRSPPLHGAEPRTGRAAFPAPQRISALGATAQAPPHSPAPAEIQEKTMRIPLCTAAAPVTR
ncbi:hypothetical protein GCM10020366_36940 [Saccharopolyspora gregorii]|uniref:Uncharacterized protein n=1 Tax=Saccharopolyspora gregorii TaxID=33914 RepID=A0ABP6RT70_9PSEU